ncbi:MAG: hypothetical protein HWE20_11520 [Gammaproteobacteria bacterium]|nr:hypothetical protein [Gammaproteobacteria bacterium]
MILRLLLSCLLIGPSMAGEWYLGAGAGAVKQSDVITNRQSIFAGKKFDNGYGAEAAVVHLGDDQYAASASVTATVAGSDLDKSLYGRIGVIGTDTDSESVHGLVAIGAEMNLGSGIHGRFEVQHQGSNHTVVHAGASKRLSTDAVSIVSVPATMKATNSAVAVDLDPLAQRFDRKSTPFDVFPALIPDSALRIRP